MKKILGIALTILLFSCHAPAKEESSAINVTDVKLGASFPVPALIEAEKTKNSPTFIQFRAPVKGPLSKYFVDVEILLFYEERKVFRLTGERACLSYSQCESITEEIKKYLKEMYQDLEFIKETRQYHSAKADKQFFVGNYIAEGSSYHAVRLQVTNKLLNIKADAMLREHAQNN